MFRPSHLSLSPPFFPFRCQRVFPRHQQKPHGSLAAASAYITRLACVFSDQASLISSLCCAFVSYLPVSAATHSTFFPTCVFPFFLAYFLILMSFCITIVLFSFFPPHLKASLPLAVHPHPFAVCTHFHSLSFISTLALLTCDTLSFFFPFLFFLSVFFSRPPPPPSPTQPPLPSSLTPLPSMLRWESHNAS